MTGFFLEDSMICEVIVDIKNNQVNRAFDYLIPSHLEDFLEVGHRVKVTFGNRLLLGIVVGIKDTSSFDENKLKPIVEALDIIPPLNQEFIELAKFMGDYYFTFYISALETMIPSALKAKYQQEIIIEDESLVSPQIKELFGKRKAIKTKMLDKEFLPMVKKGLLNKSLSIRNILSDKGNISTIKKIAVNNDATNTLIRSAKGRELYEYLSEIGEDIAKNELQNDMGYSASVINNLVAKGILKEYEEEVYRRVGNKSEYVDKLVTLNDEQQQAFNSIKKELFTYSRFLIHGVTGSGKTEIYLRLIQECIASCKEAIMLVPEISLTPQMVNRVKARFKENVAVLHSGLSMGEKYDEWRKVLRKEVKIVVGARSAIFAPFTNIGIIIIDEEHEQSYKQDVNPKYDAIHIASIRAKKHQATLVLGSATPRVETYYRALQGEIKLLEIKNRANNAQMPQSNIVDMRQELKHGNRSIFSKYLNEALKKCLQEGNQAILFLNRRGHSSFVMCRECGEVIKCPHCDLTLTYHQTTNKLRCHQCGYQQNNVECCPSCHSHYIRYVGGGTQKVEEEVNKLFPEARVLRIDYDTTSKKNAIEMLYETFEKKEADVLVGTQIITKGLDFPDVTLVGVLNADMSLKLPFYDAFETTFDLLAQVSGRAGRANKIGEVFIQTYDVNNYAIKASAFHNYKIFYEQEIKNRELFHNPPFYEMVEIVVSSLEPNIAYLEANRINKHLLSTAGVKILGPFKHHIFKVNDYYRYVINIRFKENSLDILQYINSIYQNKKDMYISITRM